MKFFSDFGLGVSTHIKAFEFISKHRLWLYFLYPLAIMIVLFIVGFFSTFALGSWLANKILDNMGNVVSDNGSWAWVNTVLSLLIGLILKVLLFVVFSAYLKYIVLIVCSPVLALLSERVDEIITGRKYPFNFAQFLKDMFRGILVTLRNMLFETLIILACFVIAWLPVIGWLTIPFIWIIGWYFLGFNMMDYTYERRRISISAGASFTRKHKGIAIGNGMIFSFLLAIPFIGITLGPILSVVAGTLATLERMENRPVA